MKTFEETIENTANKLLNLRYHEYMGGGRTISNGSNFHAEIISYIYDFMTPEQTRVAIEQKIQVMCQEKEWRDFSQTR